MSWGGEEEVPETLGALCTPCVVLVRGGDGDVPVPPASDGEERVESPSG